jgi:hypothetical protein
MLDWIGLDWIGGESTDLDSVDSNTPTSTQVAYIPKMYTDSQRSISIWPVCLHLRLSIIAGYGVMNTG